MAKKNNNDGTNNNIITMENYKNKKTDKTNNKKNTNNNIDNKKNTNNNKNINNDKNSDINNNINNDIIEEFENTEEEMTVDIELEDGTRVLCSVVTIFSVRDKDYIALLPLDENGNANEDGEIWFYGYSENPDDPNEEPELIYIEDDDEYEQVEDAFDEYLDNCEFDEILSDDDDDIDE